MNIRFVSSLTPEDEDRIAPGLVTTLGQLLDAVPIAYTLRVETASGKLYQHAHAGPDVVDVGVNGAPADERADYESRERAVPRSKTAVS